MGARSVLNLWSSVCYAAGALLVAFVLASAMVPRVHAASFSGPSTGYAFGAMSGQGGTIFQGHFANHYNVWCPGDPSAYWPMNTLIWNIFSSVVTLDGSGNPSFRTAMNLRDVGDPGCIRANYWADWYFGRYKRSFDACSCNNAQEVCYNNWQVNNCSQATSWGVVSVSYQK